MSLEPIPRFLQAFLDALSRPLVTLVGPPELILEVIDPSPFLLELA